MQSPRIPASTSNAGAIFYQGKQELSEPGLACDPMALAAGRNDYYVYHTGSLFPDTPLQGPGDLEGGRDGTGESARLGRAERRLAPLGAERAAPTRGHVPAAGLGLVTTSTT